MTSELRIPLFDPDIGNEEIEAVSAVLRSKWLSMGDCTTSFERKFAEFIQCPYAVAVNNCTSALHLSLLAVGVGPGDEVICPSLTFVATANAIRYCGAEPVFADVHSLEDWNVSVQTIEPLVSKATKAIIVVHYAGYVCDMAPIQKLAQTRGIAVIEDAAHAPGATRNNNSAGASGDVGCFSFFPNKNMTTGEGGMITTSREDVANQVRSLRSHAMTSPTLDRHKGCAFSYDVVALGYNYRMSEINAALGLEQLRRLPGGNKRRACLVSRYREKLADMPNITVPFLDHEGSSAFHIMSVLLPDKSNRQSVMVHMRESGIQTSIHYHPINTLSSYSLDGDQNSHVTVRSQLIGERTVTLPLYPSMTLDMVDKVVAGLGRALDD